MAEDISPCVEHPPANLTPLDPPEITEPSDTFSLSDGNPAQPYTLSDNFRHTGWHANRAKIRDAMVTLFLPDSRITQFAQCGSAHWILRHKTDSTRFKVVPDHCHDRFCLPCGAQRAALIRHNLVNHLDDQKYRLLTLTVRSNHEPLETLMDRLYRSFRRLRQRAIWKDTVDGGIAFFELTHNPHGGGWHPHLHCILEGRYIDRPALSRVWLSCTGDSTNVDLSLIRGKPHALHYVTKYATKPLPGSVIRDPELLAEAIRSLSGRRLIIAFGRWKPWHLLTDPTDKDWSVYCHSNELIVAAGFDDQLRIAVAAMVRTADPHTGEFFATCTEDP